MTLGQVLDAKIVKAENVLPLDALRLLRSEKPEIAIGLGCSTGEHFNEIVCEGPLWRGATQQVEQDARWHIGSITKSITATLILQQVKQGRLDSDRSIEKYVSDCDSMVDGWRHITLAQLLSHTSGAPPNPSLWTLLNWRSLESVSGRKRVLAGAWRRRLKNSNEKFVYSNLGYMLAGLILEDVLEMPWESIVRAHIAAPLGLNSLGFGAPSQMSDPKGHRRLLFNLRPMDRDDIAADNPSWLGPAGTVHMSISDLLTYGRAFLKALRGEVPHFLSQQSCLRMRTPVGENYGLGWAIEDDVMLPDGSNTMWYAMLAVDPKSDTVAVVTQNAMTRVDRINEVVRQIIRDARDS